MHWIECDSLMTVHTHLRESRFSGRYHEIDRRNPRKPLSFPPVALYLFYISSLLYLLPTAIAEDTNSVRGVDSLATPFSDEDLTRTPSTSHVSHPAHVETMLQFKSLGRRGPSFGKRWQIRRLLQSGTEEAKDNDPDQYGDDLIADTKEKAQDMGEMVSKILGRLEDIDDPDGKQGRFSETLEKQEAVLETVARVGKHRHKEGGPATEAKSERKPLPELHTEGGNPNNNTSSTTAEKIPDDQKSWMDVIRGVGEKKGDGNSTGETANDSARGAAAPAAVSQEVETKEEESQQPEGEEDDVPRLIDAQDNEYVISNPGKGSKMSMKEDITLISDIVKVIVSAAIGGLTCGLLGQPIILGYLAAGMAIGPGGLALIHELVQVETLAQFGVVFLLFALGVEFNMAKMQGVHTVALVGGAIQIGVAMLLGAVLSNTPQQGLFVGAFLSMSSTAVVVKCLMDSNTMNTEHGQIMLGTLILQDCALGLLLAVMPALAAKGSGAGTILAALGREVAILIVFCLVAWLLHKTVIPRYLRMLSRLTKHNSELFQLGVVGVCLCVALGSEHIGLSLEVGAFVAGLMLSGGPMSEKTLHHVEPIRNIFAALFLTSIGMVMHPLFLWQHKDILVAALLVVFFGKALLIALVVRLFGYRVETSIAVGVSLAQIGEFSFVLLSRAQNLGLVSRQLYLLLMGTTALSLVLTPFAFRLVIRIIPSDGAGNRLGSRRSNGIMQPNSPVRAPIVISSNREVSETRMSLRMRGPLEGGDGVSSLSDDDGSSQMPGWPSAYAGGGYGHLSASSSPSVLAMSPGGSRERNGSPRVPFGSKENVGDVETTVLRPKGARELRTR